MNFNQVHLTVKQAFHHIQPKYFGHQGAHCLLGDTGPSHMNSHVNVSSVRPEIGTQSLLYKETGA